MKQKLLFLIVMLAFLLPARLSAYDFESGGIYYDLIESQDEHGNPINVARVVKYPDDNKYTGDIIIPHVVEYADQSLPVTSIGNQAFYYCTSLTSVEIPNSVTSIGDESFCHCDAISMIKIPNSVTAIGYAAFLDCRFKTIEIPESVTSLGDFVFGSCGLKLLIIRSKNVTISWNTVTKNNNWGLFYIVAPEGLDCSALSGLNPDVITFDPENTKFMDDGTLLTDNSKTLYFAPVYDGMSYSIPEGVTKIRAGVFCSIDGYTREYIDSKPREFSSLTIPSTIEEIESDVFLNTKIEKVNFTDWSKWYANVKLGNLYSNPYWNSTPYVGGVQMVTPEFADGITEIPDYINYGLQFKDEIELPRSIKRIGAYAFYNILRDPPCRS